MEANAVMLTLILRDAGVQIGPAAAQRLCTSMGRLGISLTRNDMQPIVAAAPAEAPFSMTVDLKTGSVTFAVSARS